MSTKMESRKGPPSVIARLMGLDEETPHQPAHKKQKVLSDEYLLEVASIGMRGKRLSHERRLFKSIPDEKKELKDTLEVRGKLKRYEHHNLPVENGNFNSSLTAAKVVAGSAQGVADSKIDHVVKYLREPDSLITDHLCNLHRIPNHLQSGHLRVLKSSKASNGGMTDMCSISGRKPDQESTKLLHKLEHDLVSDICGERVLCSRYKHLESRKELDNLPTKIVVLKPNLGRKPKRGNLYVEERGRRNMSKELEPVKMRFRFSGKRQTGLDENNMFMKVSKPGSIDNTCVKEPSLNTLIPSNSSVDSVATASMRADMVTNIKTVIEGWSNHNMQHTDKTDCKFSDISIGTEHPDSPFYSCSDPESLVYLGEARQSSPNSILEPPFDAEILSTSGCFQGSDANLHDLQLHLQLLKSESSEAYSEGGRMIVSSDSDSEEGSVGNTGRSEQLMRISSTEEGRDFSYLVDVFTEAGFHGKHSVTSYDTWHSLACLMSPAVFEMLEKKYGEQLSWKRSERRLLFDRLNSLLVEILQSSIGSHWTKPLSTRLCCGKSLGSIEEELWMLLDQQKKQASNGSSGKVMGKDDGWLELGHDIEVIVREIEDSLIDQLAAEVIREESV